MIHRPCLTPSRSGNTCTRRSDGDSFRSNALRVFAALAAALVPGAGALAQGADLCANAQPLDLPAAGGVMTVNWDTRQATDDVLLSCSPSESVGAHAPDVWFTFQPPVNGALTVSPGAAAVGLFATCGGQQLACASSETLPQVIDRFPVQAGVTYLLAIQADGSDCFPCTAAGSSELAFSPDSPPVNDTCATPLNAIVGNNAFDNRLANTDATASCGSATVNDVWFRYVAPAAGPYRFRLSSSSSSFNDGSITLYSSCGGPELACAARANGIAPIIDYPFVAGQAVLVRVASQPGSTYNTPNVGPGALIVEPTPVPPNDTCAGALPITTGTTLVNATNTYYNTSPAAPCAPGGTDTNDVWYSYTAPSTGAVNMTLTFAYEIRPYLIAADITVYSGCGGNVLACYAATLGARTVPWICALPVTQGQTYIIRIASFGPNPFNGGFANLTLSAPSSAIIPTNSTCETAQSVGNGNTNFDTTLVCNPLSGTQDVFFKYTNTTTGLRNIRARTCGSSFPNVIFVSPACDSPVVLDSNGGGGCTNDPNGSTVRFCLAPGESAILDIFSTNGSAGPGVLNITSSVPATNDSCANAIELHEGNNSFNTTLGCGQAEIPCVGPNTESITYSREVWYSFTAPYNGTAHLYPTINRGTLIAMTLRNDCNGPILACEDNDRRSDINWTMAAGQRYLISVSESINDSGGDSLDFGTGTLHLQLSHDVFSIPEDVGPEPEECDFPSFAGICSTPGIIAPINENQGYFGTMSVFDPIVVYKDIIDGYYFDLPLPGFVRFTGQTQFPGYLSVFDNGGFDTCDENEIFTQDLNNPAINTFDTGLVYIPHAGTHYVQLMADSTPDFWRLCYDHDISYWIRRECVDCTNPCDPDVNQDGNADQGDVDYLVNVVAGGSNPTGIDPDFNRDGNADQGDVDALLNVVAGGPCP